MKPSPAINMPATMDSSTSGNKFSHYLVAEAFKNLILAVSYLSDDEQNDIIDASHFGDIAHIKDKRKSGEPYITHPISVAEILAGFRLDRDTIIAAILHDTVEDTEVTLDQLTNRYGTDVAQLVDGVTKLKSSKHNKQQNKSATFHKILIATLDDPRVLIIKLADRLHNMSTLGAVRAEKQRATAQETLDFYIPFARVMGLNDIADYIEILCYRNLNVEMYNKMSDKLLQHGLGRNYRKNFIQEYLHRILGKLLITGHVIAIDHKVSLFRQFFRNRGEVNELLRQYAFEIVLDTTESCKALSDYFIHRYQISPKDISDNIRHPLPGGNQSLTLFYQHENDLIKVIILTKRMQKASRLGVIGENNASEVSQSVIHASLRNLEALVNTDNNIDKTIDDINESDINTTEAIIQELMHYLHARKILCYSPLGRAYEFPHNATVLDFAYAVGPKIGHAAVGALIDAQKVDLATVISNGQTIEVLTDVNATPKAEWLGFIVTSKARDLIQKWFKQLSPVEKVEQGSLALARALQTYDKKIEDLSAENWQNLLEWRQISSNDELYEQISTGKLPPQFVLARLFSDEIENFDDKTNLSSAQPLLANLGKGVEISFSNCCNPIYGDPILAHNSKNHGLVIHRHKCYSIDNIRKKAPNQIFHIEWQKVDFDSDKNKLSENPLFPAFLKVSQLLTDDQISEAILHLRQLNVGVETIDKREAYTVFHIIVRSRTHLAQAIRELRALLEFPNIIRLYQVQN